MSHRAREYGDGSVSYLCLEEDHDILKLHVGIDLNDERLSKLGDECELHTRNELQSDGGVMRAGGVTCADTRLRAQDVRDNERGDRARKRC